MAINIENERVCELVREAAERTGQPQASVLEAALTRYLEELTEVARREGDAVYATLARIDATLTDEDRDAIQRTIDRLYGEDGLPS